MLSVVIPCRTEGSGKAQVRRLPPGASEVILQVGDGVHPAHLRNLGAARATGDVLYFSDDDVRVDGDLRWFDTRPQEEAWWSVQSHDATGDPDTRQMAAFHNAMAALGCWTGGSVGAAFPIRRSLFWAVGGFRVGTADEGVDLGERLHEAGMRPVLSPLHITYLRPSPPILRAAARAQVWNRWPRPASTPQLVFRPGVP